ncbi:Amt family ammonium transporter [Chryseomicrobium aureum]|uniref:ammonium transporter n=1 Tax=Chryseomicrobium aureum TaxID=1441723 RepID=UPI001958A9BD|nr:ammonium transporter [Chryseomicrobium aureum]MBM7706930.1 Amt family ammonium transporter [Chryseomicrobium aureum]
MTPELLQSSINMLWIMLGTILVFFMHAGFAMVESGFTRSKNTVNILMKNFITVSIASLLYFVVGYALMFGDSFNGLIGTSGFALTGVDDIAFFVFQAVFAATAATIISGAVAERMKLSAYFVLTIAMVTVIYPVVGHWIWSGGWLAQLGFIDFAGSTVVHLTGATGALVAAAILGPRIGKYTGKKVNVIPGHSIPLGALGVFILWLGWFGFNGASTLAADPAVVPSIITNTLLAASAGVVSTALYTKLRYGQIDASLTLNGALSGLVGITAGAANVSLPSAIIIGFIAGIVMTEGIRLLDAKLRVDDPVGAITVHGIIGVWGTLAVGLFDKASGLFTTGSVSLLAVQAVGIIAVIAWVSVSTAGVVLVTKAISGIRVSEEEEVTGLDYVEHGTSAYEVRETYGAAFDRTEPFAQRLTELGKSYS